ncbi:MAG: hypothetical protein Q7S26_04485 [bacterium]|nr:hypothetical protein [bacterium]
MTKTKYLAPLFGVLMLLSVAFPAQASSLTSAQISAIISLLQAFNADPAVVANVQAQLGGSSTSSQSCSDFSDLGIDSNTFGFGTYGRKTQTAWNSKCGGTILTPVVTTPVTTTTAASIEVKLRRFNLRRWSVSPNVTSNSAGLTCGGGQCRLT